MQKQAFNLRTLFGMAYINILNYLDQERDKYPPVVIKAIFYGTAIGVGACLAVISLFVVSRAGGEVAESVLLQIAMATAVCVFFGVLLTMVVATFQAVKTLAPEPGKQAAQLEQWHPPLLADGDKLVCLKPGGRLADFTNEWESVQDITKPAFWAAIIPPFRAEAAILTGSEDTDFFFPRGAEPFSAELLPEEMLPAGLDHCAETYAQYCRYVEWFAKHYNRWAPGAKLEANKTRAKKTFFETVKAQAATITLTLALLFVCLPGLIGQSKTRQVDEALGTRIREIPKTDDAVLFVFDEDGKQKEYKRTGNSKAEYTTLLQRAPGIGGFNDAGGRLVYISLNGEVIARGPEVEAVEPQQQLQRQRATREAPAVYLPESTTGDPVRPRRLYTNEAPVNYPNSGFLNGLDSQSIVDGGERLKDVVREGRGKFWASVKPAWAIVMWFFGGLFIVLICFLGLFRYFAKSGRNESLINTNGDVIFGRWVFQWQQNAAMLCLIIMWIICGVLLINEFLWLVWWDWPIWLLVVTWFPSLWLAEIITDWAVPNPRVVGSRKPSEAATTRAVQPY